MEQPEPLTPSQSGGLLAACLIIFLIGFSLRLVASPIFTFMVAGGFTIWIYQLVPSGKVTLDFKVGMVIGATLALVAYDMVQSFFAILLKGY